MEKKLIGINFKKMIVEKAVLIVSDGDPFDQTCFILRSLAQHY